MYNEDTIRNTITQRDKSTIINDDFLHNLETLLDDALEAKQSIETGPISKLIGLGCLACVQNFTKRTNRRIITSELRKFLPRSEFEIRSSLRTHNVEDEQYGNLDYYIYNEIYNLLYEIQVYVHILNDEEDKEFFDIESAHLVQIRTNVENN